LRTLCIDRSQNCVCIFCTQFFSHRQIDDVLCKESIDILHGGLLQKYPPYVVNLNCCITRFDEQFILGSTTHGMVTTWCTCNLIICFVYIYVY